MSFVHPNTPSFAREHFSAGKAIRAAAVPAVLALLFAFLLCSRAYADVGIVLNESLDESMDRITGTGHSAVYFSRIFKQLDREGTVFVDPDGSAWMELSENGEPLRVGVSASNVLARSSNPRLAYKLLLARTRYELKDPRYSRETMREFQQDWARLELASVKAETISADNSGAFKSAGATMSRVIGKN